jgi:DNA (cytosine-5)-methyltransferase 1
MSEFFHKIEELFEASNIEAPQEDNKLETCGSIFSGIGGWEYGAKSIGLKPVFGFEFHQKYADIYKKGHGDHITIGDVRTADKSNLATVDVLFSSPPCQNYSVAKHNKDDEKADSSKDVGLVTIEIAEKSNAKVILMENVRAYLTSPVFKQLEKELGEKYHVHTQVVNCAEWGCPTTRVRMIATFVRKDLFKRPFAPKPTNEKSNAPSWYDVVEDIIPTLKPKKLMNWQQERLDRFNMDELNFPLQISGTTVSTATHAAGKKVRVFRQKHQPSFTIVKTPVAMGMYRILLKDGTSLECTPQCFARWQSFPDEVFKYLPNDVETATNIIGNAVPPKLCENILKQLKRFH